MNGHQNLILKNAKANSFLHLLKTLAAKLYTILDMLAYCSGYIVVGIPSIPREMENFVEGENPNWEQ